jgi:hypothetical protein
MTITRIKKFATDATYTAAGELWDGAATKVDPDNYDQGFVPGQNMSATYLNYLLNATMYELAERQSVAPVLSPAVVSAEITNPSAFTSTTTRAWHSVQSVGMFPETLAYKWVTPILPGAALVGAESITPGLYNAPGGAVLPVGATPLHCACDPASGYLLAGISNTGTNVSVLYLISTAGAVTTATMPAGSRVGAGLASYWDGSTLKIFGNSESVVWVHTVGGSTATAARTISASSNAARNAFVADGSFYLLDPDYESSGELFIIDSTGTATAIISDATSGGRFNSCVVDPYGGGIHACVGSVNTSSSDPGGQIYGMPAGDPTGTWENKADLYFYGPALSSVSGGNVNAVPVKYLCKDAIYFGAFIISVFYRNFGTFVETYLLKHTPTAAGGWDAEVITRFPIYGEGGGTDVNISLTRKGPRTIQINRFVYDSGDLDLKSWDLSV